MEPTGSPVMRWPKEKHDRKGRESGEREKRAPFRSDFISALVLQKHSSKAQIDKVDKSILWN